MDNATLNWGDSAKAGPGVITPPVTITFHRLGPLFITSEASETPGQYARGWGSFDGSTNAPIIYPDRSSQACDPFTLRFALIQPSGANPRPAQTLSFTWRFPIPLGGQVALQASTNFVDWLTFGTATNMGAVVEWDHNIGTNQARRFFRAVPR